MTEITLIPKKLQNLQHSQVTNNGDNDTWVLKINQQVSTKPKFYILWRWVLSLFAHDKPTNAWNSLGKHAINSASTEMVNYHLQIDIVADCLT